MPANAVAENVLGTIGAICWSVQLVPQVVKSYRRKDTAGLSSHMLAIWFVGGIFLGAFVVVQNINVPLLVQPQCFALLAAVSWAQCLHYDQGWSTRRSVQFAIGACVLAGGLETACIFGAKAAEARGITAVTTTWGVLSAIFITGGLIPQYVEIYRFKAVIGISLIFLLVDLLGGVFSLLSLVFAVGPFETLASVSYGAVVILEIGVFILVPILNPKHHRRLATAAQTDQEALAGGSEATSPVPMSELGRTPSVASSLVTAVGVEPVEAKRGRVRDLHPEFGTLGWMDPGVALEEAEVDRTRTQSTSREKM